MVSKLINGLKPTKPLIIMESLRNRLEEMTKNIGLLPCKSTPPFFLKSGLPGHSGGLRVINRVRMREKII